MEGKMILRGGDTVKDEGMHDAQCLKIKEKVSFNIASEASYAYILSGQKFIKKRSKWSILASFCGQTVLPDIR